MRSGSKRVVKLCARLLVSLPEIEFVSQKNNCSKKLLKFGMYHLLTVKITFCYWIKNVVDPAMRATLKSMALAHHAEPFLQRLPRYSPTGTAIDK